MQFSEKRNLTRWIIIMASFVIVTLILWNTYTFFQIFKEAERVKMELWAESLKTFNNAEPNTDEMKLPLLIMSNNKTIPIILTENGKIINQRNIDESTVVNQSAKKENNQKQGNRIIF